MSTVSDIFLISRSWKKYRNLWMFDKATVCEKYIARGLPLAQIDEKFLFYSQIIETLRKHPTHHQIMSIRINLKPLIDGICEHAIEWQTMLGEILADRTNHNIMQLKDKMKELRLNLDCHIKGLKDFKMAMETIGEIQSTTLTVELKIRDMQETFSVLQEHKIRVKNFSFFFGVFRLILGKLFHTVSIY